MDEAKLKKILDDAPVPPPDENARKRAVNLAVAEFKSLKNQNKNSSQGVYFFARLTGRTNQPDRRDFMGQKSKQRLVYGGMATAMAVVLITGVTLTQLRQNPLATAENNVMLSSTVNGQAEESQEARWRKLESSAEMAQAQMAQDSAQAPVATMTAPAKQSEQFAAADMAAPAAPPPVANFGGAMAKHAAPQAMRAESLVGNTVSSREMYYSPGIIAPEPMPQPSYHDEGRDKFEDFKVSPVKITKEEPVSTFSIDVDTASYSFVRGQLNNGVLPQKDAVRVEEMINYFDYNYPLPETKEQPFKPSITVLDSPWSKDKKLVHIGIKGFDIEKTERPHSNLVFLLDTSGSMDEPNKLPLVKNSLKMLLDGMNENDKISIVVYAGSAGMVLEPTPASEKAKIIAAIDNLSAGGSTAGAEGINLAYKLAEQNFDKEGVNRVILATDGDFNVGITNPEELQDFVERKRETGIFLSVFGFGSGNYNDALMQTLAQNGNGAAAYIDNLNEARKVLVEEASSTLFPIAKDVKIQVEWNPALVSEYRLIGYETRALNREDFNNDKVDAGDIGAGHAVTAIYEITPAGSESRSVDELRYGTVKQAAPTQDTTNFSGELGFLKLRYKLPKEDTSKLITAPIDAGAKSDSVDANWAVAVAGYAQLLKGDPNIGTFTYDDVIKLAQANKGDDPFGIRAEFINLVRLTKTASAQ